MLPCGLEAVESLKCSHQKLSSPRVVFVPGNTDTAVIGCGPAIGAEALVTKIPALPLILCKPCLLPGKRIINEIEDGHQQPIWEVNGQLPSFWVSYNPHPPKRGSIVLAQTWPMGWPMLLPLLPHQMPSLGMFRWYC